MRQHTDEPVNQLVKAAEDRGPDFDFQHDEGLFATTEDVLNQQEYDLREQRRTLSTSKIYETIQAPKTDVEDVSLVSYPRLTPVANISIPRWKAAALDEPSLRFPNLGASCRAGTI